MYDYQIDYKKIVKFETLIIPTIKWLVKLTSVATFIFFFLKICDILTCPWVFILIPILIFYVLAVFIPIGLYCYWLLTCMFYLKQFVKNMNYAESFIQKCKRHPENEAPNLFEDNSIIFDGHHFSLHNIDEEKKNG